MKPVATLLPAIALVLTLAACGSSTTKTVTVPVPSTTAGSGTSTGGGGSATTGGAGTTGAPTTGAATTTGANTTGAATSTTISRTSTAGVPMPTRTVHLTNFRSPSGNIGCVILDGTARCDISQRMWVPPSRPASCPKEVDFGQGLLLESTGAGRFVCAGDTALDPTGTALPYGSASVEGSFSCVSETTGVTCSSAADGHGFFISRQSYRLF